MPPDRVPTLPARLSAVRELLRRRTSVPAPAAAAEATRRRREHVGSHRRTRCACNWALERSRAEKILNCASRFFIRYSPLQPLHVPDDPGLRRQAGRLPVSERRGYQVRDTGREVLPRGRHGRLRPRRTRVSGVGEEAHGMMGPLRVGAYALAWVVKELALERWRS